MCFISVLAVVSPVISEVYNYRCLVVLCSILSSFFLCAYLFISSSLSFLYSFLAGCLSVSLSFILSHFLYFYPIFYSIFLLAWHVALFCSVRSISFHLIIFQNMSFYSMAPVSFLHSCNPVSDSPCCSFLLLYLPCFSSPHKYYPFPLPFCMSACQSVSHSFFTPFPVVLCFCPPFLPSHSFLRSFLPSFLRRFLPSFLPPSPPPLSFFIPFFLFCLAVCLP